MESWYKGLNSSRPGDYWIRLLIGQYMYLSLDNGRLFIFSTSVKMANDVEDTERVEKKNILKIFRAF